MLPALVLTAIAQMAPPQTREFVLAPGETISATIFAGDNDRTIVIVPGMLGSAYGFRHIAPNLAERGYRVIIVDMLGTGGSSQPVRADYSLTAQSRRLEVVLDSLKVRAAILVPQAVGGSVAYRLTFHRPDVVRAIVGIDAGAAEQAATSGVRNAIRFAPLIRLFGARRILTGKIKEGLVEASYDAAWVTPEVVAEYAAPYRENASHMLRVLNAMTESHEPEPIVPNLPKINVPVLLLVGTAPKVLSPEKIDVLRKGLRNFKLERVPKAGQLINEEQPQAVTDAILRVAETPPQ
jgi:pimeloyl-ACP methyl ester carboxylesterase